MIALVCLMPVIPWWLLGLLGLAGIVLFPRCWEALAVFFFYDLAYGLPETGLLRTQFSLTIIAVIIFVLVESYKDHFRFYRS